MLLSLKDGSVHSSASIGTDPVAVIVSSNGRTAYIADSAPGDVYAASLPALKVLWKQHVGGAPFGLLLHDGHLFVSLFDGGAVDELDPASGAVLTTHATSQGPAVMTVDASGRVAVAGTHGQVNFLDGTSVPAGRGFGIAVVNHELWTADYDRGELVNVATGRHVALPQRVHPFWLAAGSGATLLIAAEGAQEDSDRGGVFSYDTMTAAFTTLGTPRDPDQVVPADSAVLVPAHGDHEVLAFREGRTNAWARGAAAVALAPDPALGIIAVVVNSHE